MGSTIYWGAGDSPGTTPVGCKGRSRYVDGCWGFPYSTTFLMFEFTCLFIFILYNFNLYFHARFIYCCYAFPKYRHIRSQGVANL